MEINTRFDVMARDYEQPEVKLEIKLKPYAYPPTNKTPALTGYVTISKIQLKAIEQVIDASEGGRVVNLRVALWDSRTEEGGVAGVIEYKEYSKLDTEQTKQEESKWY
jgi:hypothetical protein